MKFAETIPASSWMAVTVLIICIVAMLGMIAALPWIMHDEVPVEPEGHVLMLPIE